MRRRILRPEEEELWQAVARTAQPLAGRQPGGPQIFRRKICPPPQPVAEPAPEPPPLPGFRIGERAPPPAPPATPAPAPLAMDARTHARMRRGKLAPEARIDLHGLTLAEAHPELIRFILNAQSGGLRLVLVITGKGSRRVEDHGPIPQRAGALRHQVPLWLRMPPLGPAVLQVTEAHLRHGGSGACYVYLRRR
jgi:DNA-nicking Smr family endonuclease